MAISDKLLELNQIKTDIKTAITNKGQTVSDDMNEYASAIDSISTTPNLQEKTANPSTSTQNIVADSGYDGLSKVTVNPMTLQQKVITPSAGGGETITPDSGYDGLKMVYLNPPASTSYTAIPSITEEQNISTPNGKLIKNLTIPIGITMDYVYDEWGVGVGTTKQFTFSATVDLPETTSSEASNMATTILVVIQDDDDSIKPIVFPFMLLVAETTVSGNPLDLISVLPKNGYSNVNIYMYSMSGEYCGASVNLEVVDFDNTLGSATLTATVTTESGYGEYDILVYRVHSFADNGY